MTRKKLLLVIGCVIAVAASAGALTWAFWPEPPPTTADEVVASVMECPDPSKMSDAELDRWIQHVASVVDRLPPHESQKLIQQAMANQELQQRFRSLSAEQRERLFSLISEEQRRQMQKAGAKAMQAMVVALKVMPKSLRDKQLRAMHERMQRHRREGGRRHEMTKERFAEWHASTTPRERAEFVRTMREMRRLMDEAGIRD